VIGVGAPDVGFASPSIPPEAETVVFDPDRHARDTLARRLRELGMLARFEAAVVTDTNDLTTVALDSYFTRREHKAACLWVDADGGAASALASGADYLGRLPRLVVVINPAREDPESFLRIAQSWRLYLNDVRAHRLVRLAGDEPDRLQRMLDMPWLDSRRAVLLPSDRDLAWRPL